MKHCEKLKVKYTFQKNEEMERNALEYIINHVKSNLQDLAKHKRGFVGFACFAVLEKPQGEIKGPNDNKQ